MQFYKPVLLVIIPVFLFSVYCSLWLNAETQAAAQSIIERSQNVHEFKHVKAGQFNQSKSGEHVFFMESLSDDRRQLNNVIISETGRERMVLETAKSGRQVTDDLSGNLFLVLGPGQIYQGQPGAKEFKIIEFEKHGILLRNKNKTQNRKLRDKAISPGDLWKSHKLEDRIELHWRIAIPVILLVLALLAVPLSHIMPRQGRYGKLGYALLVYIIYFNLMVFARAKLESESISITLNFWWVHLFFVVLTLALLVKRNGGYRFALEMVRR